MPVSMPLEETVLNADGVRNVKRFTITNTSLNVLIVTIRTTPTWKTEEFLRNALDATRNLSISVQTAIILPSLSMLCVEIAIKHLIEEEVEMVGTALVEDSIRLPASFNYLSVIMKSVRI